MIAVIQEAYVHGISTRSVDDLVKAMGMTGISKSQVSRLCEEIDGRVNVKRRRRIDQDRRRRIDHSLGCEAAAPRLEARSAA